MISNFKTYGAVAVMLGCFAIVYPRFMHPMLFGSGDGARKAHDSNTHYPPGQKPDRGAGGGASPEDVRRHMRHGPHPGMRAAAEMQRQQSAQGSGRGMMGVVLPMYAVGIVLYLGYTLYKVFNKTSAKTNGAGRYSWDKSARSNRDKDRMGFPKDYDGNNAEIRNFLNDQEHRQNLEEMLTRVDDKNVSVEEMKVLQQRLEETEAQMTRILQAMRGLNDNVDSLATPEADGVAASQEGGSSNNKTEHAGKESTTEEGKPKKDSDDKDAETERTELEKEADQDKEGKEDVEDGDEDVSGGNAEDEGDNEDGGEGVVDEMILDEKKDKDADDDEALSSVRQRNVKANEQ